MKTAPAFVFLLCVLLGPLGAADAPPGKPNIIFVLFDDLGYGQPQSYNAQSALRTPNLDKLEIGRAHV